MKIALLFPGQGAQYVGMGKALYENNEKARAVIEEASQILDWDLKEVCFEDARGRIHQTRYTQPALFTINYATWEALKQKALPIEAVLGFSLGEYDAIAASEALSFREALALVEKRAIYMDSCSHEAEGGMAAVIGLKVEVIESICKGISQALSEVLEVANDNCPEQVTIAGTQKALEHAIPALKEAGAKRVVLLKVSGAFHTSLMKVAAQQLEVEAAKLDFKATKYEVISNVTAGPIETNEILKYIPTQITTGVRFRESILNLIERGFDTFIEVGPKTTLSHLVKKINPEVQVFNVEEPEAIEKLQIGGDLC